MKLKEVVAQLDEDERNMFFSLSASEYLNKVYHSKEFSPILKKLNTKEKLTIKEWEYLVNRLLLVTFSALAEEDKVTSGDKFRYTISKIGLKICRRNMALYNECFKMIRFIDSIDQEIDINMDLVDGLDRVRESGKDTNLNLLLQQHREAASFRDNKTSFIESYKVSDKSDITDDERKYMAAMISSYNREKSLVKEYN